MVDIYSAILTLALPAAVLFLAVLVVRLAWGVGSAILRDTRKQ